jgi:hypothetical protein
MTGKTIIKLVKIQSLKKIGLIFFYKLWIFTIFIMVFPVIALVFDFYEFSEGVQDLHCLFV